MLQNVQRFSPKYEKYFEKCDNLVAYLKLRPVFLPTSFQKQTHLFFFRSHLAPLHHHSGCQSAAASWHSWCHRLRCRSSRRGVGVTVAHGSTPPLKLTAKAPENGWLEYDRFLLAHPIFTSKLLVSGSVS